MLSTPGATASAGPASAGPASTPTPSAAQVEAVPLMRLDHADPQLLEELMGAVRAVAERGAFTLGEHVEAFEREFAAYCETDHAIGVSSGTEALVLALRALEIGPGDEVIVPTNSFIATAEAVSAVGATPRLVDVDPDSHLITAEIVGGQPHAEGALRDSGAPVRGDGRSRPDPRAHPRGRRPRRRGRLPSPRRSLPRPAQSARSA